MLRGINDQSLVIIDRSSEGLGWKGKQHGVGFARKTVMDAISHEAVPGDIMVCLDADTVFSDNYFLSLALAFKENPETVAISVPYFHQTTGDEITDRAMLRYEIYMRHYFLSLARIGSPYAFTALGSAMAIPVWAYRAIGGITPKLSGEDFYFLQKLRKFGTVSLWNDELVFPEARFSDRVFFGTGPAMIRGAAGDWSSYPIYDDLLFKEILLTYQIIPVLYHETLKTEVTLFLSEIFGKQDPLASIRRNHRDLDHFTRAFHENFDGLRILQFLKTKNQESRKTDEMRLQEFLGEHYFFPEQKEHLLDSDGFTFSGTTVRLLDKIRNFLFEKEMEQRFISTLR
jgi:hypothetical protein